MLTTRDLRFRVECESASVQVGWGDVTVDRLIQLHERGGGILPKG